MKVLQVKFNMCSKNYFLLLLVLWTSTTSIKAVLNPDDEDFFGETADRYDWSKHPCRRNCTEDEAPKICNYVFVVEQYLTMSKACYDCPFNVTDCARPHCLAADGVKKPIYTVNRKSPGPAIEVCLNDVIVVEVRNNMLSESTSIHWHGIHQMGTPYMDGVPFVTQCPISPGERFRYTFNAVVSGTYFWHSHIGAQRSDGLYGPLLIRAPQRRIIHRHRYDIDDNQMILIDWSHNRSDSAFIKQYHDAPGVLPGNILVNGHGRFQKFTRSNTPDTYTPLAVFTVEENKRHRFRLINAGAEDCPIIMSIDNHSLLVISLDSNDIEPIKVDAITTWPGERVDFVVNANKKSDNYWIRYRGFGLCEGSNATNGIYQVAILRYSKAPIEDPKSPIGYDIPKLTNSTRVLNPFNTGTESSHVVNISIPLLNALTPNDPAVTDPVDQQIYIAFDFNPINNYDFHRKDLYAFNKVPVNRRIGTLQLNHISFKFPSVPLMSQWEMVSPNRFCNESYNPENLNCTSEQCACTHVINLKLNSVVEIVFVDGGTLGAINHPLHLHGHFFRVIAEKNLGGIVTVDRVKQLDREGKITRRLNRAPLKDTIKAPGGGYTIVRLFANNPGYWYFHCHFEQHTNVGMSLIFKVGEHEDFPEVPRGFPKCGGFVPKPEPDCMK